MVRRWKDSPSSPRVNSVASLEVKPPREAVTSWSEPRAMTTLPGVTAIE